MARRLAGGAEVVGRGHEPAAEQVQPDPVDHHAGGQRVRGRGEPVRQLEAAAARCDRSRTIVAEHADEPAGDDLAGLVELAADVERAVDGLVALADAHREGAGRTAGAVDEQAMAEHREHRGGPPEPVAVRLARRDRVALADQGGEALLHRGPLLGRERGDGRGDVRARRAARSGATALKFGKTPASVPEQVCVLRKMPDSA